MCDGSFLVIGKIVSENYWFWIKWEKLDVKPEKKIL